MGRCAQKEEDEMKKKNRHEKGNKKVQVPTSLEELNTPKETVKKVKTVQDAWDQMKAARELPKRYTSAKAPEYNIREFYPLYDSKTNLTNRAEQERVDRKKTCSHKYESGRFAIAWQEHSQHIIMGVCKHCFSPFDIRNAEDKKIYDSPENQTNIRNMAHAGEHSYVKPSVPVVPVEKVQWYQKVWMVLGAPYASKFRRKYN